MLINIVIRYLGSEEKFLLCIVFALTPIIYLRQAGINPSKCTSHPVS